MLTQEKRNLLTLENVVILLSFVLAVFVRCYRLSDIPYGMHIDEAGMGYDAWGIATVRADRWLNVKPLYLVNYGGGQSWITNGIYRNGATGIAKLRRDGFVSMNGKGKLLTRKMQFSGKSAM